MSGKELVSTSVTRCCPSEVRLNTSSHQLQPRAPEFQERCAIHGLSSRAMSPDESNTMRSGPFTEKEARQCDTQREKFQGITQRVEKKTESKQLHTFLKPGAPYTLKFPHAWKSRNPSSYEKMEDSTVSSQSCSTNVNKLNFPRTGIFSLHSGLAALGNPSTFHRDALTCSTNGLGFNRPSELLGSINRCCQEMFNVLEQFGNVDDRQNTSLLMSSSSPSPKKKWLAERDVFCQVKQLQMQGQRKSSEQESHKRELSPGRSPKRDKRTAECLLLDPYLSQATCPTMRKVRDLIYKYTILTVSASQSGTAYSARRLQLNNRNRSRAAGRLRAGNREENLLRHRVWGNRLLEGDMVLSDWIDVDEPAVPGPQFNFPTGSPLYQELAPIKVITNQTIPEWCTPKQHITASDVLTLEVRSNLAESECSLPVGKSEADVLQRDEDLVYSCSAAALPGVPPTWCLPAEQLQPFLFKDLFS